MATRSPTILFLSILSISLLIAYTVFRTRSVQRQHLNGHAASGSPAGDDVQAETVLSVGELYVTYDSTAHDSALWIARPAENLRSWLLPPAQPPFNFDPILRWKQPGRVVWSNSG